MKKESEQGKPTHRARTVVGRIFRSTAAKIILVLVFVLIGVRIALPYVIEDYVNKKLNQIPGYSGHVGDIDMKIWRGAYTIKNVTLNRATGKVPVPFFAADVIELSIEWKELIHGALVGRISLANPKLNFVEGKSQQDSQTKVSRSWQDIVQDLFPLKINRFTVDNGEIHFRSFTSKPKIDVFIHELQVVAENLTNSAKVSKTLVATIDAQGLVMSEGRFKTHLDMDPFTKYPTFQLDAELTNVNMRKMNDFLLAYGKFDVEHGIFSLYAQFAAAQGKFEGYVKPFFKDVQVLGPKDKKNPGKAAWEAIVGGVKDIFKNKQTDEVVTRIPFSGRFDQPGVGVWEAIGSLLRNAFVRAILPGFDEQGNPKSLVETGVQAGEQEKR